jgi:hypothetical protein
MEEIEMNKKKGSPRKPAKKKEVTRKKTNPMSRHKDPFEPQEHEKTGEDPLDQVYLSDVRHGVVQISEACEKISYSLGMLKQVGGLDRLREKLLTIGIKINKDGSWDLATADERMNKEVEIYLREKAK